MMIMGCMFRFTLHKWEGVRIIVLTVFQFFHIRKVKLYSPSTGEAFHCPARRGMGVHIL